MARTIVIDACVVGEINRGNKAAADALRGAIGRGDTVYISRQAYQELTVKPDLPRTATANRELLRELHIEIAPPGPMAERVQVYGDNQMRKTTVLSEADSLVAAQAKAIGAEMWSLDRAFRLNRTAVEGKLGIKVAPESYSIPLVSEGGVKPPREDYRVARQSLGLPPVEITVGGRTLRPGPPGAPPGVGGPPVTGSGGGGGGSTGGPGGSTTASVGIADNTPVVTSGPNPVAVAGFNAAVLGLQWLNSLLSHLNDKKQNERIQQEFARLVPMINAERAKDPANGVLLVIYFRQRMAHPDSPLQPGAEFTHIEMGVGYSRDEARDNLARKPALREAPSVNVDIFSQEQWIPPLGPARIAALRTPFPQVGTATFAEGKRRLQNVEWGGIFGFDDEDECELNSARSVSFILLRPPRELRWFDGQFWHKSAIPLAYRKSADGTALEVVDLDPWVPGSASGIPVFPADDATDRLLSTAPPTRDNLGQLRLYLNLDKVRWVRPENVRVLQFAKVQAAAQ